MLYRLYSTALLKAFPPPEKINRIRIIKKIRRE